MPLGGGSWFQLAWWVKLSLAHLEAKWLKAICRVPALMWADLCLPLKHCAAHVKMPQMGLGKEHVTDFNEISDLESRLGAKLKLLGNSAYVTLCFLPPPLHPAFQSNILQDWDQFFHLWQCFWLIFFCLPWGDEVVWALLFNFLHTVIQLANFCLLPEFENIVEEVSTSVFTNVILVTSASRGRKGMCRKQWDLRSCQTLRTGNFKYSCAQGPKTSKLKK